jgi:hypothetical protein
VFRAHVNSKLKSEVLADPAKFIELDDCLVRESETGNAPP